MASNETPIKQVVAIRRKPDMTRKEFLDHHYQVHGSISDRPEDVNIKPHKYIQIHLFDGAFGGRPDGINTNHSWSGRDDLTELYFRDWTHLKSVFSSDYVKTEVAPDALKFSDIETPLSLMAHGKPLALRHMVNGQQRYEGKRTVAMLWLSPEKAAEDGISLESFLSPKLVGALETHAADEVWGLLANVGIQPQGFDLKSYFGGTTMPSFVLVYKVLLKDCASVAAVRKAQTAFYEASKGHLNLQNNFIVFGIEGLIMDMANNIRFDPQHQPQAAGIPGKSHLDG